MNPGVFSEHGLFVCFEGGEGAGKSTQSSLLRDWLVQRGQTVLLTFEPGDTGVGKELRRIVLDPATGELSDRTEALLYAADKAEHVDHVVMPALDRGEVVVTDRYVDSTLAYQGAGRELGTKAIFQLNNWATDSLWPDLTVLLDVSPESGRQRRTAGDSTEDRMESEPDAFHATIRAAFLELAAAHPDRYLVLPAGESVAELADAIEQRVTALMVMRTSAAERAAASGLVGSA